MEVANLKPLSNKRPKTEAKNYGSISILPLISELLLEVINKSIHDQIKDNLIKNDLLYIYQSSFRSNRSTDTSL